MNIMSLYKHRIVLLTLSCLCMVCAAGIEAAQVSMKVNTKQFSLTEAAVLTIIIEGEEHVDRPVIPSVDGLDIQSYNQSSRTNIINGVVSSSLEYSYAIMAKKSGTFTIPSFEVLVGNQSFTTEPLTLTVAASQSRQKGKQQSKQENDINNYARMSVSFVEEKRDEYYVGEMIPIKVDLMYLDDVISVSKVPELVSDAFTTTAFSNKPEISRNLTKGGHLIYTYSWVVGLMPIKAGSSEVILSSDLSMQIRTNQRSRGFWGMGSRYIQKKVALTSEAVPLKVISLPSKNQPESFSGAIGQFDAQARTSTDKVMIGDPITLKIFVKGKGNFERVESPKLSDDSGWKAYKANSTFSAEDSMGYKGKKIFEQALIPLKEDVEHLTFSFTYFDPKKKEYVQTEKQELPLTITKGKEEPRRYVAEDSVDKAQENGDTEENKPNVTDEDGLAPISIELGNLSELETVCSRSGYIGFNLMSLLAIAAGIVMTKVKNSKDSDLSRKKRLVLNKRVQAALQDVDSAMKNGEVIAFFDNCRCALQLQIADKLGVEASAVTVTEIRKLQSHNPEKLIELFDMADAVKYSGHSMDSGQLADWRAVLEQGLRGLEA